MDSNNLNNEFSYKSKAGTRKIKSEIEEPNEELNQCLSKLNKGFRTRYQSVQDPFTKKKRIKCDLCDNTYSHHPGLRYHRLKEHGKYPIRRKPLKGRITTKTLNNEEPYANKISCEFKEEPSIDILSEQESDEYSNLSDMDESVGLKIEALPTQNSISVNDQIENVELLSNNFDDDIIIEENIEELNKYSYKRRVKGTRATKYESVVDPFTKKKRIKCDLCDNTYSHHPGLRYHRFNEHGKLPPRRRRRRPFVSNVDENTLNKDNISSKTSEHGTDNLVISQKEDGIPSQNLRPKIEYVEVSNNPFDEEDNIEENILENNIDKNIKTSFNACRKPKVSNKSVQTDVGCIRTCGYIEVSIDYKMFSMNCFYCEEAFPIWSWGAFVTHLRDAHQKEEEILRKEYIDRQEMEETLQPKKNSLYESDSDSSKEENKDEIGLIQSCDEIQTSIEIVTDEKENVSKELDIQISKGYTIIESFENFSDNVEEIIQIEIDNGENEIVNTENANSIDNGENEIVNAENTNSIDNGENEIENAENTNSFSDFDSLSSEDNKEDDFFKENENVNKDDETKAKAKTLLTVPCYLCEKLFSDEVHLQAHQLKRHNIGKPRIRRDQAQRHCDICDITFKHPSFYRKHVAVHKPPAFKCHICAKEFRWQHSFNDHLQIHANKRDHVCELCGARFICYSRLRNHIKVRHSDDKKDEDLFKKKKNDETKTNIKKPLTVPCNSCGKFFRNEAQLLAHQFLRHTVVNLPVKQQEKREQPERYCKLCNITFKHPSSYRTHLAVHNAPKFKCHTCGKEFRWQQSLTDHLKMHNNQRDHVCELCGASFFHSSRLRDHKKIAHLDEKNYACHICECSFKTSTHLCLHRKKYHLVLEGTIEDLIKCPYIRRPKEPRATNYQSFEDPVTKTKRIKCDSCDNTYSHHSALRYHRFKEHGKLPIKRSPPEKSRKNKVWKLSSIEDHSDLLTTEDNTNFVINQAGEEENSTDDLIVYDATEECEFTDYFEIIN